MKTLHKLHSPFVYSATVEHRANSHIKNADLKGVRITRLQQDMNWWNAGTTPALYQLNKQKLLQLEQIHENLISLKHRVNNYKQYIPSEILPEAQLLDKLLSFLTIQANRLVMDFCIFQLSVKDHKALYSKFKDLKKDLVRLNSELSDLSKYLNFSKMLLFNLMHKAIKIKAPSQKKAAIITST